MSFIPSINTSFTSLNLTHLFDYSSSSENSFGWKELGICFTTLGCALGASYLYWKNRKPKAFTTVQDIQIPERFCIRLVSYGDYAGLGDVVCGLNTLKFLKKVCPNADIMMVTNATADAKALASEDVKEFITDKYNVTLPELPTLVIQIPNLRTEIPFPISQRMSVLKISEYSEERLQSPKKNERIRSSGLNKGEMGIIVNEKLRKFGMSKRQSDSDDTLKKANSLDRLENTFLKELLLQGADSYTYAKETKLFYGYTYSFWTAFNFLMTVVKKEENNAANIDIYIPAKRFSSGEHLRRLKRALKDEDAQAALKAAGISEFELVTATIEDELTDSRLRFRGENNGKKLRLIVSDTISQKDVKHLYKASEDYTCITGDQSLGEAISMGKIFSYEMLLHKSFLFSSLTKIWQSIKGLSSTTILSDLKIPDDYDKQLNYAELGKKLNLPGTSRDFAKLSDKIATEWNFFLNLGNEVNRFAKQKAIAQH